MILKRVRVAAAAVLLAAAALVGGHFVPAADAAITDASWSDSEYVTAPLKATAVPTITFTGCTATQGSNSMSATWKFNGPTLPGQSTSWVVDLGLNVISGANVTTSGPDANGVYTTTASFTSLSLGTYSLHPTTKLGNWTAASTNHPEALAITVLLATVWGSCSIVSGA